MSNNKPKYESNTIQLTATNPKLYNFNLFENSRMDQVKNNLGQVTSVTPNLVTYKLLKVNSQNGALLLKAYNQDLQSQLNFLSLSPGPMTANSGILSVIRMCTRQVNLSDLDILKSNNLIFLNKLTYSQSTDDLIYCTTWITTVAIKHPLTNLAFTQQ